MIQEIDSDSASGFMILFHILLVYLTNVSFGETIDICADDLYCGHVCTPWFPENIFKELMLIATEGIEFSFNNVMYSQIDVVAMGSPSGTVLANNFVDFYEDQLSENVHRTTLYY